MLPDENLVYEEHFKARWEMYGEFLQQSFFFEWQGKLILTVFCMQKVLSPHNSVPKGDYLLMEHRN